MRVVSGLTSLGQQETSDRIFFFFREKKLELRVAATGAADPEKEVAT